MLVTAMLATMQIVSMDFQIKIRLLAEQGFDPRTSGLWAQHASAAPLCLPLRLENCPFMNTAAQSTIVKSNLARLSSNIQKLDRLYVQIKL